MNRPSGGVSSQVEGQLTSSRRRALVRGKTLQVVALLGFHLLLATSLRAQDILITEFMAVNDRTLPDEDGDYSDWIELFNPGTNAVNLGGWYLTDRANLWEFPATILPPTSFLVVFASGKNRTNSGGNLHANFSLSGGGEYLGLVRPDGLTIASEFSPGYPPQTNDVSYGYPMNGFALVTTIPTFLAPTPGTNNGRALLGGPVISDILHSPLAPQDDEDIIVTTRVTPRTAPLGMVTLHYRIMFEAEVSVPMFDDGVHNDADAGDGIFGAMIPASVATNGQMVRWFIRAVDMAGATSREPGFLSPTASSEYLGTVVNPGYVDSELPVVHLFITPAALTAAGNDSVARYQCSLYWMGEFYDNVGINRHGQSGAGWPKKSYDIDFNADHHFKPSPELSRVDDINLLTTYADKAHMRNHLSYGVYKNAGSPYHYVVSVRVQTNGGFYGDWNIVENGDADFLQRIGRDPNGALYKMYNAFTDPSDYTISSSEAEKKTRKYEGNADLVALYNGLRAGTAADRQRYMYDNMNVAEIVNTMAARIVTSDVDCCHKNYYFYRDSDGTGEWEAFPWDVDLAFGRNWQSAGTYWDDRVYPNNGLFVGNNNTFFQLVFTAGSATRQMYLRRVRTLMDELQQTNGTPAEQLKFEKQIDELAALIAPDAALDLAKWGTWGGGATGIFDTNSPYWRTLPQSAAELKTNYMVNRRRFVFDMKMNNATEFPNAQPTNVTILIGAIDYNPSSGNQAEEYIQLINTNDFAVDISGWTLNGAVEHTFQGGVVIPSIAPSNQVYVVADKKAFRARTTGPRGGQGLHIEGNYKGQLSARGETIILADKMGRIVRTNMYMGNPSPAQQYLRITEIMYHPHNPLSGPYQAEDFEFIELMNVGPVQLDLTGVRLTNGVTFSFTGVAITALAAGQRVVVVKNREAFQSVYGNSVPVSGEFTGSLANEGESFRLDDARGETILDVLYDNDWYPITDGPGFSLVIVDENADPGLWGSKTDWRPSSRQSGSPGAADPPPVIVPPVLANEILSNAEAPFEDAIELHNPTGMEVEVSGWWLTDDKGAPKKFRIPKGTFIPAGGFLAFDEHTFNPFDSADGERFAFRNAGDEVYLFAADLDGNLTGYFHGFAFGAADSNVTFGRHVSSLGSEHFVAQAARTLSDSNAGPRVGPVVISEIMYHPLPKLHVGGVVDTTSEEFIELHNITDQAVPLFYANVTATNAWLATNTWRLNKGVNFDVPTNVILPPGGFALVVNFDPRREPGSLAAFRRSYDVPDQVAILGPYNQKLSNSGETLELCKPGLPATGRMSQVLVDRVDYLNRPPWPWSADGIGASLQRINPLAYGNEPQNWTAALPSPGRIRFGGTAPAVVRQPPSELKVVAGTDVVLTVSVEGTAPFRFQWQFNGRHLAHSTNGTLVLSNIQPHQAGSYSVAIVSPVGGALSSNTVLTVVLPASVTLHPADALVRIKPDPNALPNTNAAFRAAASSSTPLRYQWQGFDGAAFTNLVGETQDTLVITNVQLDNAGDYRCAVTDNVGTVFTEPAKLIPLITPVITQAPLNQTVPVGSLVGVSVTLGDGNPPPFYYEWRRASTPVESFIIPEKRSFFNFTAPTSITSQLYRLIVTNRATTNLQAVSSTFTITTVADTDRDGLPDAFEASTGLNTNNAADAMGDLDGDTMTNVAEYLAGTDPTNPNSYLRIEQTTVSGMTMLQLGAVSNRTYSIQFTTQLPGGIWSKLADVPAQATNWTVTLSDPRSGSNRFYRVATPWIP